MCDNVLQKTKKCNHRSLKWPKQSRTYFFLILKINYSVMLHLIHGILLIAFSFRSVVEFDLEPLEGVKAQALFGRGATDDLVHSQQQSTPNNRARDPGRTCLGSSRLAVRKRRRRKTPHFYLPRYASSFNVAVVATRIQKPTKLTRVLEAWVYDGARGRHGHFKFSGVFFYYYY